MLELNILLRLIRNVGDRMVSAVAFAPDVLDKLAFAEFGKATLDSAQRKSGLGDDFRGVAAGMRLYAGQDIIDFLLRGHGRLTS